jgi:hypothetical protein
MLEICTVLNSSPKKWYSSSTSTQKKKTAVTKIDLFETQIETSIVSITLSAYIFVFHFTLNGIL